jgi:hypothetical protein
MTQAPIFFAL